MFCPQPNYNQRVSEDLIHMLSDGGHAPLALARRLTGRCARIAQAVHLANPFDRCFTLGCFDSDESTPLLGVEAPEHLAFLSAIVGDSAHQTSFEILAVYLGVFIATRPLLVCRVGGASFECGAVTLHLRCAKKVWSTKGAGGCALR
eukprot:2711202-Amphidinium_carterae.1